MSASSDLYIKSVSHVATSDTVIQFFKQTPLVGLPSQPHTELRLTAGDDIKRVDFLTYPNSKHRYCRVSFNTSEGVTSAMNLNGEMLNGVPTRMSVVDPALDQWAAPHEVSVGPGRKPTAASESLLIQQENEEMARTVCFRNIPPTWTEIRITAFLADSLGMDSCMDLRVDQSVNGETFALVLLQDSEAVDRALSLDSSKLDVECNKQLYQIRVERAQSVVRVRDPNIQFGVDLPSLPPVPIAYQSVKQLSINKKVEQAKERLAKVIAKKLSGEAVEECDEEQTREEIERLDPENLKAHSKRKWSGRYDPHGFHKRRRQMPPYASRGCWDEEDREGCDVQSEDYQNARPYHHRQYRDYDDTYDKHYYHERYDAPYDSNGEYRDERPKPKDGRTDGSSRQYRQETGSYNHRPSWYDEEDRSTRNRRSRGDEGWERRRRRDYVY